MPPKKEIDLKNLDLTHIYTPEEIEHINNHLKTRINFENGRLLPIPQSPIANEAVVHEISRQLGNWNVETGQNEFVEKIISQKYDEDELLIEESKENEDQESEQQTSEKDLGLI
ncbi:unnamed protein product [Rhizophagus irregularis]|nr:unnamed protein product [Rhizophagus irregularis]